MAHFAKLDEENNVTEVHVVNNDVIMVDGNESEQAGIDFLTSLHNHPYWKQTSYSSSFRKNYAGIGFKWREDLDGFVPQQPFSSWTLNETTCIWDAPTPMPTDGKPYAWFEPNQQWIEVTGPQA